MAYADLATIQATDPGDPLTAAWCDQARDDFEFLIDPPACSVSAATPQSVNNATLTVLAADAEGFDNDAMHSTVSNNSRITAQTAGRYLAFATVRFALDADGARGLEFLVNGSADSVIATVPASGVTDIVMSGSRPFTLSASDYIEVRASHSAGAALNVTLEDFTLVFVTR